MTFTLRSFDIFSLWLKIIGLVSNHAAGADGVNVAVLRKGRANLKFF
jgi:hypothetical protein